MGWTTSISKSSWVTRHVPAALAVDWKPVDSPRVGDVLLCEVTALSLHSRVETWEGFRSKLYPGDRLACALGNRYATAMLEGVAEVTGARIDLLSASGVCGRVVQRNDKVNKPTELRVVGQGFVEGSPFNLRRFALGIPAAAGAEPFWLVVVGSAMDSGKTSACASLISALAASGWRVGAAKLTGTASARDYCSFRDAGAVPVLDFLDAGWPSTAGCSEDEVQAIAAELAGHLRSAHVEVGVLEIADGLLQKETESLLSPLAELLGHPRFILTARESLAAVAGVERLRIRGLTVLAASGVVTNSPLARREVELTCGVPCVPTRDLGSYLARDLQLSTATSGTHPAASLVQ